MPSKDKGLSPDILSPDILIIDDLEKEGLISKIHELHAFILRYRYRVEMNDRENPKFIDDLIERTKP